MTKDDRIQKASFYDGAMKPIPARETQVTTKSGAACQQFCFDAAAFNDEMQLVLDVHPQVDDLQLPVDMENVDLP